MNSKSVEELLLYCEERAIPISKAVLELEAAELECSEAEVFEKMRETLSVMREAAVSGISTDAPSPSGLSGGVAKKMAEAIKEKQILSGAFNAKAVAYAIACAEVNASMGKIVAAPTAGSCGILPGALLAGQEEFHYTDEQLVNGLLCASGIGLVIASRATLAGAEGGCQAECGSASAMAAAALTEIAGGSPRQCAHAAAIALKCILGLVCDPVAGLVEVPCIKRNASGVSLAITAADMALAGIESAIPVDEVIDAMGSVGVNLPTSLKETAEGGLAATPTAQRYRKQIFGEA